MEEGETEREKEECGADGHIRISKTCHSQTKFFEALNRVEW